MKKEKKITFFLVCISFLTTCFAIAFISTGTDAHLVNTNAVFCFAIVGQMSCVT